MKTLSTVTSAKNESDNILKLYSEIDSALLGENYNWKLFICDNGSTDDTWEIIKKLTNENTNVVGIQMTRDFGSESSIFSTIQRANSDVIIMMASDLQDPPSQIAVQRACRWWSNVISGRGNPSEETRRDIIDFFGG
jgi:glycosyltransferase involved in cell wall biosynthesis